MSGLGRWSLGLSVAATLAGALAATGAGELGCSSSTDVHDTAAGKQACINCHASAYRTAQNPLHLGVMPETCGDCHTTAGWSPVVLGPDKHSGFPLQNKHAGPSCNACHTKGFRAGDTSKVCASCHQKDVDGAQQPSHVGFPTDCKLCHNDLGWQPSIFQHPWPLANKHAAIACSACHTGTPPKFVGLSTDCASCHQKDFDDAANPIHRPLPPTGGMLVSGGRTCADCHTSGGGTPTGGWRPNTFVHPKAPFELTGAHADPATVTCNDCHQAPLPAGTTPRGYDAKTFAATTCIDCHRTGPKSFTTATPPHATFPTECRVCHSTSVFKGAVTHPEAKFTLLSPSKHNGIQCVDCHDVSRGASTAGANTNCAGCHGYAAGTWAPAHALPALDQRHATNGGIAVCTPAQTPGPTTCFPNPTQVNAAPNVCRVCHAMGKL